MKNTIMIVRGDNSTPAEHEIHSIYRFLKLTAGNWRNSLYVRCRCGVEYMLTADEDGKPVLFPIELFYELTGEYPQKDEMCGVISRQAFENMYRGWLLWNTDGTECPVHSMYEKMKTEVL